MLYANSLGADKQPYKYSGKELDNLHGLDLYDSQARWYSGSIPGFTTQDPLAEKYYGWSPYAYCLNNPMKYVDSDGREVFYYVTEADKNGKNYYVPKTYNQLTDTQRNTIQGFIRSEVGKNFISQFISGSQDFGGEIIKGNATFNQDLKIRFDEGQLILLGNGETLKRLGATKPNLKDNGKSFFLEILVDKFLSLEQMAYTFGHEALLHGGPMIENLIENFKAGMNEEQFKELNKKAGTGHDHHKNYSDGVGEHTLNFKKYLNFLKGWNNPELMQQVIIYSDDENKKEADAGR